MEAVLVILGRDTLQRQSFALPRHDGFWGCGKKSIAEVHP
jgi:hypothetical protein